MPPPIVIYYHQLVRRPRPDHTFLAGALTPEQFRRSMLHVKEHYHPLRMEEMIRLWQQGRRWPPRAVLITFDDGFKNNLWAARILHELDLSATFFVLSDVIETGFIPSYLRFAHVVSTRRTDVLDTPLGRVDFKQRRSRRMWMLRAKEHLQNLPPSERDALLDELAAIFGSVPIDPTDEDYHYLSTAELRREIVESRARLEAIVGRPIDVFSYPDGRFNQRVLALTAQHYQLAFGYSEDLPANHPHAYPRRVAGPDVARVLSHGFPLRRRFVRLAKRLLGEPLMRADD